MIDTDKYEGHTPAPWIWPEEDSILLKGKYEKYIITGRHLSGDSIDKEADAALIADAPLLLEEVKRLREILGDIIAIDEWGGDGKDVGITITYSEGDSFMGWLDKCDDEVIE